MNFFGLRTATGVKHDPQNVKLEGMSVEEIEDSYGPFPREAIPEVLMAASELLDTLHVAA